MLTYLCSGSEPKNYLVCLSTFLAIHLWLVATVVSAVPKTLLSLNDMLGAVTWLRRHYTLVMVYYYETLQVKTSKGKTCMGRSPEETKHKIPVVLSQWSHRHVLQSPRYKVWQHSQWVAILGSSSEPWCPEFFLEVYHIVRGAAPDGLSSPPEQKQAFTTNDMSSHKPSN